MKEIPDERTVRLTAKSGIIIKATRKTAAALLVSAPLFCRVTAIQIAAKLTAVNNSPALWVSK